MNTTSTSPSVLFDIHGNAAEWRSCFSPTAHSPRLPLPFAFASLSSHGVALNAFDSSGLPRPADTSPFRQYFTHTELATARKTSDFNMVWGTKGLTSCFAEIGIPHERRKTILLAYGWHSNPEVSIQRRAMLTLTRRAAQFARGLVLMTGRQIEAAQSALPPRMPVIHLRVGIDTRYYAQPASINDVPDEYQAIVSKLLDEPFFILPGDELRLNGDALRMVRQTGLRLVRVSQYGYKSGTNLLKEEIVRLKLQERVIVFENINYPFLRFLLQHAAAYAGFVDASWQPAGWTVACECLASGLPLVLYDGLTSRELADSGVPPAVMRVVLRGDKTTFDRELMAMASTPRTTALTEIARNFAATALNAEGTAPEFARNFCTALRVA